jgi:DNA (cytosine-5)-methyltransferase 1
VFENPAGIGSLGELGSLSEMDSEAYQELPDREAVELTNIINDVEKEGYEVQPVRIPACAVGAPHIRDRIFIIANRKCVGRQTRAGEPLRPQESIPKRPQSGNIDTKVNSIIAHSPSKGLERGDKQEKTRIWSGQFSPNGQQPNPDTSQQGLQGSEPRQSLRLSGQSDRSGSYEKPDWSENWIEVASRFCSMDDGIPDNLARPARNKQRVQKLKACGNAIVPMQIYYILKAIADIENL